MGDEKALPPSKKRAAGREISRDNPGLDDEEDVSEQELGTFKKASEEVLAGRRIVKVRRQTASSAPSAPSSNPFAGIRLVPPVSTTVAADQTKSELQADVVKKAADAEDKESTPSKETDEVHKLDEKDLEEKTNEAADESSADKAKGDSVDKAAEACTEETDDHGPANGQGKTDGENAVNGDKKEDDKEEEKEDDKSDAAGGETTPFSSFQQLSSSKNAFTGFAGTVSGTGFSTYAFSSGSGSSLPSFSFGSSNNGSTPLFSAVAASGSKTEGPTLPSMQEVPVETGEENDETVFSAESALFEFSEGGWKERGKGEVKVNLSNTGTKKARLVMRARGNYRLILNAYLYPDMKLTKMDKKGVTFACLNSATEEKTGLATIALKFKDPSFVETFCTAVAAHKGEGCEAVEKEASEKEAPAEISPKAAEE